MSDRSSGEEAIARADAATAHVTGTSTCACCTPGVAILRVASMLHPTGRWLDAEGITHLTLDDLTELHEAELAWQCKGG